jgi:hypothetical protein
MTSSSIKFVPIFTRTRPVVLELKHALYPLYAYCLHIHAMQITYTEIKVKSNAVTIWSYDLSKEFNPLS